MDAKSAVLQDCKEACLEIDISAHSAARSWNKY